MSRREIKQERKRKYRAFLKSIDDGLDGEDKQDSGLLEEN